VGLRLGNVAAVAAAIAVCAGAPAAAATINAQARAKVVKPLAIESRQNLDLGTILLASGSWSAATVRLERSGALTCPAPLTCSGATQVQLTNSGNPGSNFPIGGAITIDSTTAGGVYVGTFDVTAEYQ
jgi:hypothetical protein